jgi:hypothetical protein
LLGLKLKRENNVYKIAPETLADGRQEIFSVWQQRDELILSHSQKAGFETNKSVLNQKQQSKEKYPVISAVASLF